MIKRFQHYIQLDRKDCGPTWLQMIAKHYRSVLQDMKRKKRQVAIPHSRLG